METRCAGKRGVKVRAKQASFSVKVEEQRAYDLYNVLSLTEEDYDCRAARKKLGSSSDEPRFRLFIVMLVRVPGYIREGIVKLSLPICGWGYSSSIHENRHKSGTNT